MTKWLDEVSLRLTKRSVRNHMEKQFIDIYNIKRTPFLILQFMLYSLDKNGEHK